MRFAKAPTAKLLSSVRHGYNRARCPSRSSLRSLSKSIRQAAVGPRGLGQASRHRPLHGRAIAAFAFNRPVIFMDTKSVACTSTSSFRTGRTSMTTSYFAGRQTLRKGRQDMVQCPHGLRDHAEEGAWQPNTRSAHYTRQSPFENSNRQCGGDPEGARRGNAAQRCAHRTGNRHGRGNGWQETLRIGEGRVHQEEGKDVLHLATDRHGCTRRVTMPKQ